MNYEDIESSIVTQLAPLTPGTEVIPLPETPQAFDKTVFKRRLTVCINASATGDIGLSNDPVISTGAIVQVEKIQVLIICEARAIRGAGGLYELLAAARLLLIGFAPAHCDKLYLRDFGIAKKERDDGVWSYMLKLECKTMIVEDNDDRGDAVLYDVEGDPIFPTLTEATAEDNLEESSTVTLEDLVKITDADGEIYYKRHGDEFSCLPGVYPDEAEVASGVKFGPTGEEFTGTLEV